MSSTPFDFFDYRGGELCAERVPLAKIAAEVGTPCYVYSAEAFLRPLRALQEGLREFNPLVCFAVKANSNLSILRLLGEHGAGCDLVSSGEMQRARAAGVSASRIVFSGVGKTRDEIRSALDEGIYSFHVESVPELELINQIASDRGCRARVAFRYNPNVDAKTHPYISTGLRKNKFGLEEKEILALIPKLDRFAGIDVRGLSIHIGSQLQSLSPLKDAFLKARALARKLSDRLATPLEFVDLGGGLGIQYKNERVPTLDAYTAIIRKIFRGEGFRILIEPGRTLAGNSGVLLTEVLFRKNRTKKDFLIVDAAMNDLLRPALYSSYHGIVPLDQTLTRGAKIRTDIVGPVCESSDCFAGERPLSKKIGAGHRLAILSAGAYGFTMSSNYNSRPRPAEVLVEGERYRIIRARENFSDLVRQEIEREPRSSS